MTDLRASVALDLKGNLSSDLRRTGRAMRGFARTGTRELTVMDHSIRAVGRNVDRLGNRWLALATGVGGVAAVRSVSALQERFKRLEIQSNSSAERIEDVKQAIFDLSRSPSIAVDPSEITAAVEEIVTKTGDLDLAQDNLEAIAAAIGATNAAGRDIGAMVADLQGKFDLKGKDHFLEALDTLVLQGKAGSFTLNNLASQGNRVTAAYSRLGRGSVTAAREMGALLQLARRGTGSPEQTATALEAAVRDIIANQDKLQGIGIEVFDVEESQRQGREVRRSLIDIIDDIRKVAKSTGDEQLFLSKIFGEESIRLALQVDADSAKKFLDITGDGSALLGDAANAADTAQASMIRLHTAWSQFADRELLKPIQTATDFLNSLDNNTVDRLLQVAKVGGAVLASTVLLRKVGAFRAGAAAAGGPLGAGGALGMPSGPIPVYIVNAPTADVGGGAGTVFGNAGDKRSKAKPKAPISKRRAGTAAVGASLALATEAIDFGVDAFDIIRLDDVGGLDKTAAVAGEAAKGGAGVLGAVGGATLGTAVLPGIGTAIGAILGGLASSAAVDQLIEALGGQTRETLELKVQLRQDARGRLLLDGVDSSVPDTHTQIDHGSTVAAGAF